MLKKMFSEKVKASLGSYVYCLIDPRDSKIFYVGKGKDNRVFEHMNSTNADSDDKQSDKIETIKEIINQGLEVKHYILRHGLSDRNDDYEAFLLESILIDLLNNQDIGFSKLTKLTNIMGGMGQRQYGIKDANELEAFYDAKPLDINNLKHKILFINVNQRFDKENLYDVTRKFWKLAPQKANQADYVVCESRGLTRAIFKVDEKGWQRAEDYKDEVAFKNKNYEEKVKDVGELTGRFFFEGKEITDAELVSMYVTKSVHRDRGASNPIRYSYK